MVTVQHLDFAYKRKEKIWSDLTLELSAGHIHGLLGSNGVGKSTLLKLFAGLLFPDNGVITVGGYLPKDRKRELLQELFFLPEEFTLPAISFATFGEITSPFYPNYVKQDFVDFCNAFEVDVAKRTNKLSMGQRKKGLIAFALACHTKYLFMDEPTNGLDIPSKGVFRRLIASVAGEEQTIVISTHQVKDVETLIDNVVICDQRGLLLSADTARISERLYFGTIGAGEEAIYKEASMANLGVRAARHEEESHINLELLFSAVLADPRKIDELIHAKY